MAIDPSVLVQPIDGPDPCGPDLEAAGDPDFLAFLATAEGQMPSSFFSFEPSGFDHEQLLEEADALLARSRDVRLLVLAAKAAILGRDLARFTAAVDAIRRLLEERWEHVKPAAEDGDYAFRLAPLYNLDDAASLVFPLQFAPLVQAPRLGAATYRSHLLATEAVRPREGETADADTLARILSDCDLDDLVAARDRIATLKAALAGIDAALAANAGYEHRLGLDRLPGVVDGMLAFLEAAVVRRDASLATGGGAAAAEDGTADGEAPAEVSAEADAGGAAPVPAGPVADQAAAAAALDAVIGYYRTREPSSPAVPLLEQARASVGRSLYEVIAMLVPEHAASARIHVGGEPAFVVPLAGRADGSPGDGGAAAEHAPITTRREATAALDQVSQFFRQSEPSSPVPLLIERARALGSRDFLSLLKDVLPQDALKTMKIGG